MILYVIRHGDPNYQKDCLTELGTKQAILLANRLEKEHFDKVYCSSHGRAIATCEPSVKKWNQKPIIVDWAREDLGAQSFVKEDPNSKSGYSWIFWHSKYSSLLTDPDVVKLGRYWYKHPYFSDTKVEEGVLNMNKWVDDFLLENGYRHNRDKLVYEKIGETPNSVVIFAHGGFALSFLSSLLDIPYNIFSTHMCCMGLTGITVVDFGDKDICFPILARYNDCSHLDIESDFKEIGV